MARKPNGAAASADDTSAVTITAAFATDDAVSSTVERSLAVAVGDRGTIRGVAEGTVYDVDFGASGSGLFVESELEAAPADATDDSEDTAPAHCAMASRWRAIPFLRAQCSSRLVTTVTTAPSRMMKRRPSSVT